MIGREGELHRLVQLASTAGTDVAILAGEPGIGKSRLVRELLQSVPDGITVLVGQAEPGSLGRPFELLLSALDGRPGIDPAQLERLTDTTLTQVERLRTGLQILLQVTAGGPAVVVFEDLHWADSESIALFERIADLEGDRLLLGTYRPAEVMRRNPIAGLLDRMERRYEVFHVRLERLDLSQTSAFLAAARQKPPPYRAAVALHNRTGGNPFFLEELLRDGDDLERLCEKPLPWSLAETLRRQVEHLDPAQQRLVEAASVLGYRIPFDLLAAVTQRDEADLIWALRELVAQGVLVETGEDEFAFRHALVREAMGERLLGRERRRLHEAALEALLASGDADWALVTKHARGAGRFDDMLRAASAGSAAYLRMGSAFQSLQLAETGLEECPDDTSLLATAAEAGWLAGLLDDADDYARQWQAKAATPEEACAALRLRMRLAKDLQDYELIARLHEELRVALAGLPHGQEKASAMAMLAQGARLLDLDHDALRWADETIALIEEMAGPPGVRLAAQVEKGAILAASAATLEEGRALLAAVADEAEVSGDWYIAAQAINRIIHLPPATSWRELSELLERMRRDAERAGSEALAVAAYYQGQARLFMQKGNLARAIDAIERGRAHDLGYQRSRSKSDMHGMFLAGLLLEAGELGKASHLAADLIDVPGMEFGIAALQFHLACRHGDVDRARELVPEVISVVQSTGGRGGEFLHDLVSGALVAPLSPGEVAKLIDGLEGAGVDAGYRSLVMGQLAEAEGQLQTALTHYQAARRPGDSATGRGGIGLPPAASGTAAVGAARCLLGLGRTDEAMAQARIASDLLDRWGGWRVDELTALRTRLARYEAAEEIVDQGAGTLTARERDVAVLVAEGLTNAELAQRLFISPRTAAVHVSNILRKLGVTSRTDVGPALRS